MSHDTKGEVPADRILRERREELEHLRKVVAAHNEAIRAVAPASPLVTSLRDAAAQQEASCYGHPRVELMREAAAEIERLMRLAGPSGGSVGPWKECVYKHPDAPLGGWTALADRLPDADAEGEYNRVLCSTKDGKVGCEYVYNLRSSVLAETGYWTHWQPLPNPPSATSTPISTEEKP